MPYIPQSAIGLPRAVEIYYHKISPYVKISDELEGVMLNCSFCGKSESRMTLLMETAIDPWIKAWCYNHRHLDENDIDFGSAEAWRLRLSAL